MKWDRQRYLQACSIVSTSFNAFLEGYNPETLKDELTPNNDIISLHTKDKVNLLLIEDNSADEFLVRKVLEECPYNFEIYCIHNGEEAIHYLKKRTSGPFTKPDIVLLDLNLPKLNGISVLRAIKQDRDIQDIPVLVLTNSLSKKDMMTAYKNFASGYISKSFDSYAFKKNLQTALTYWIDAVILPEAC
jgi:CheY-like chemotaxis protein